MYHPFQRLSLLQSSTGEDCLIAAHGSSLLCASLSDGHVISSWSVGEALAVSDVNGNSDQDNGVGEDERPTKKQKTASAQIGSSFAISQMIVSPDQKHVVTVTMDKCVRVLRIMGDGSFHELSQRVMPKRPCAIKILPDSATIICADKFGDVYSLPLLISDIPDHPETNPPPPTLSEAEPSTFTPSANEFTVHTRRNRRALEAQQNQKKVVSKNREPLKFAHEFLLGHVSLLTDLALATRTVDGRQRRYILTADRDEHIRVSRGPPQSHVIEGYCLGHTEYISRIALVPDSELLVSGGGDAWLGVWDWVTGTLVNRIDLTEAVAKCRPRDESDAQEGIVEQADKSDLVNVSGLWFAPMCESAGDSETILLVACEKVSALFVLAGNQLREPAAKPVVYPLAAPPLDVVSVGDRIVVSVDACDEHVARLHALVLEGTDINVPRKEDSGLQSNLQTLNALQANGPLDEKTLEDVLSRVAVLRKRGDAKEVEEDAAEGAAEGNT